MNTSMLILTILIIVGCQAKDRCSLPPDRGPCEASIKKWYYDPDSETCKIFKYGGCEGNDNRFDSEVECVQSCHPCYGRPECPILPGSFVCQAIIQGWFYDAGSRKCTFISFTGCGHCGNNFYSTEEDCQDRCAIKDAREVCCLPVDPGPCKGSMPSWYYDEDTGKCTLFIYGGCLGNDNRFQTKKACNMMCNPCSGYYPKACPHQKPPVCLAFWRRFYYDSKSGQCKLSDGFNVCLKMCSRNVHANVIDCERMCIKKVDADPAVKL